MIRLTRSIQSWGKSDFAAVLKEEIEALDPRLLPLQQGLAATSHALDGPFKVMILVVAEEVDLLRAKVGIFFSGIIAGCSCADDPTPVEPQHEYCEVEFVINKTTAETTVRLSEYSA